MLELFCQEKNDLNLAMLICTTIQMNLENSILSKRIPKQKTMYYMIPRYIRSKIGKATETECRQPRA
jgi:hypothetical protein